MTSRARFLLVGAYVWLVAVCFGGTLVDVAYASVVSGDPADVRDLLLGLSVMAIVAGIAATTAAWEWGAAGYLLLVSLVLVVGELVAPVFLSGSIIDAEGALGVGLGPWIRLGVSGSASVLAAIGFWAMLPRGSSRTS